MSSELREKYKLLQLEKQNLMDVFGLWRALMDGLARRHELYVTAPDQSQRLLIWAVAEVLESCGWTLFIDHNGNDLRMFVRIQKTLEHRNQPLPAHPPAPAASAPPVTAQAAAPGSQEPAPAAEGVVFLG